MLVDIIGMFVVRYLGVLVGLMNLVDGLSVKGSSVMF